MGDFDANGDGIIDMRIEATAKAVGELRTLADALGGAVTATFGEIDRLTGLIGKGGQMSDQFMKTYREWRQDALPLPGLDTSVKDIAVNYGLIAERGEKAVATYRAAEQDAASQFRY